MEFYFLFEITTSNACYTDDQYAVTSTIKKTVARFGYNETII